MAFEIGKIIPEIRLLICQNTYARGYITGVIGLSGGMGLMGVMGHKNSLDVARISYQRSVSLVLKG